MTATTSLAEFIVKLTRADVPDAVLAQVRRAALDTIGCMLAGAAEPVATITRAVARAEGGAPLCTVVGTSLRTAPTWAALANGAAGHAHDFDDTSFALMGHPSAPLLSAALASGEAEMADGGAISLAYLVGFEIDAALGQMLNPEHYTRGWHATTSIGSIGCAAAAARILRLDSVQTRHALGIAASLASGLKENFGSMTKPYHAGHAARNGVLAAQLAREGLTASDSALDGRQGYGAAFSGATLPPGAFDGLGRRWEIVHSGIAVKPYPSCALTHAAIDTLVELREAHGLTAAQIAEVEVGVNRVVPDVLRHDRPRSPLERKFSMQFCAAAALVHGGIGLADFSDRPVDADVQHVMERTRMVVDSAMPDGLEQHAWSRVRVHLRDGRTLDAPARGASGHADRPLTDGQLRAKFLTCAAALPRNVAEGVAEQIAHFDEIPDIRALTSRLVTGLE
jgi:2-methylcitrate dehydratase PrpD